MKRTSREPLTEEDALRLFEELYEAHYHKVAVYVRRRTRSVEDADDVVASTFLVAWRRLEDLADADEPLAWLYAVAYRTLLSHWRAIAKTRDLADKAAAEYPDPIDNVESTAEAHERLAHVTAAMADLPETDQELLRLVGWEQLTHAEIATILGISGMLVRTRLYRARRRFQAAYEHHVRGPKIGGG